MLKLNHSVNVNTEWSKLKTTSAPPAGNRTALNPSAVRSTATAWSLTFFLAQKRLDGLLRYFAELKKMPPDMELSDDALLNCFARAFGCVDASKKIDVSALNKLAIQWNHYIETTPVESELEAVQVTIEKKLKEAQPPKEEPKTKGPGVPGIPGAPAVPR